MVNGQPFKCKWGSSRVLPMNSKLKELLGLIPKRSNFVFSTRSGGMRWNNWDDGFAKAILGSDVRNLSEVTAHCLRHTFISQLISYGKVDIKRVSELAGHKDLKTTQIYTHLLGGDEEQAAAIESLPEY